jgi:membrane protease YdiL (CAAX protease family)
MMVTSSRSLPETPAGIQPEISTEEKRRRWFELFLVLALSLGTALLNSFYLLKNAPVVALRMSAVRSLYGFAHESLSLLLLAYVLSRRNLGLRDLGLRWSIRDVVPSIVVTVLAVLSYFAGAVILQALHYEMYGVISRGPKASQFFSSPTIWALPFTLLNPFFEELIVRAYVMTEIKELTGSTTKAIAFSVLLQASYHLYYGWLGAITLAFLFMVFAIYYSRSRRALPIIVAHAIFDLYALFRLM